MRKARARRVHDIHGQRQRLDAGDERPRPSGVEPADPQDVVQQPRQPRSFGRDDLEQRPLPVRVERMSLQRQRGAVDRRQRRAQLVRHDRDELVLEAVEFPQATQRPVDPALVERGCHDRPDEDDRHERRAVPQDAQDHRQRSHHRERHERQLDVTANSRWKRDSSRARDHRSEERDVDQVERDGRGDGAQCKAEQGAVP